MNYLDLFHGIGGFALGAYCAGMKFENHFCSDIEPYCQKLYKLRFPDSVQLGDITKIKTEDLPDGDWLITGGFPCQDISSAGKGAGIDGERSGLWKHYARIISELSPRWVIIENSSNLRNKGLGSVLKDLWEIGYDAEWNIIPASMFTFHKRERIWIIANPHSRGRKAAWVNESLGQMAQSKTYEQLQTSESSGIYLPEKRIFEPGVCGIIDAVPDRVDRLQGCGNSIIPKIAELLFYIIRAHDARASEMVANVK